MVADVCHFVISLRGCEINVVIVLSPRQSEKKTRKNLKWYNEMFNAIISAAKFRGEMRPPAKCARNAAKCGEMRRQGEGEKAIVNFRSDEAINEMAQISHYNYMWFVLT